MNPFADIPQDNNSNIEGDSDRLGGSFLWDTDVYEVVIRNAYGGKSSGGAKSMTFELEGPDGKKIKFTEYITSGTAKGCKPYYEKDGKQYYLPGYNKANAISIFATKKGILDPSLVWEMKKVKMRKNQQDVFEDVPVATEMLGKKILIGMMLVETNKTTNVGTKEAPNYKRTAETKFENEVDKVFYAENRCSMAELVAAKKASTTPVAKFIDEWAGKFKGTVKNDVKPAEVATPTQGGAPAPTDGAGGEVDSLFD